MPRYTKTQRIKHQLDKLGYTHQELADAIGYSRPYVTAVLNGRIAPYCMEAVELQLKQWWEEARSAHSAC